MSKTILWWGNFDPDYSRNRILRAALVELGWTIRDFYPRFGALAYLEALSIKALATDVCLVWVPCFRQRDISQAARWARRYDLPLLFDPLISAYDKQVNERAKFSAGEGRARRLLRWESKRFSLADCLLADTDAHADYFESQLAVDKERIAVVPVGAEESLFYPQEQIDRREDTPLEVLFFGSFISLQGPRVIAEAISLYKGPPVIWRFIGEGPLRNECQLLAKDRPHVIFDPWLPYEKLPEAIRSADILLGIFGTSAKAARVIPNKVYQALACGKPLITRHSPAYPEPLNLVESVIQWVPPGDAAALADAVARMAGSKADLERIGRKSRKCYDDYFSGEIVKSRLCGALTGLSLHL